MKELIKKYEEIIRYLIIGGLTTVVSLVSYYVLTITILDPNNDLYLQIANVISWILAVTFAYFTNRTFVFKSKDKASLKEASTFYASRVSTLLIDMGMMFILVSRMHFPDKIIKIIIQVIVVILNYIFSKFFVFNRGKNEKKRI